MRGERNLLDEGIDRYQGITSDLLRVDVRAKSRLPRAQFTLSAADARRQIMWTF